jgi:uncharacterized membrane protein
MAATTVPDTATSSELDFTRPKGRARREAAIRGLLVTATLVGIVVLAVLLVRVLTAGTQYLSLSFLTEFPSRLRPLEGGVSNGLSGTLSLMLLVAVGSFPLGIGAALYLEEFAPKNRLTNLIETNISNLAGVPSIVHALFGVGAFVLFLGFGTSILSASLTLAVMTGLLVAAYTTFDAYGIRATANPFTFLAWFFFIDGLIMPVVALRRWRGMDARPGIAPLMLRGVIGGGVALLSFGAIMLATRLGNVGEAAVLRETSTVFAALIGWLFLGETVGPRRTALMSLIAIGAIIVEMGG